MSAEWIQQINTKFHPIINNCNKLIRTEYFQLFKEAGSDVIVEDAGEKHKDLGSMWSQLEVQETSMAVTKNISGPDLTLHRPWGEPATSILKNQKLCHQRDDVRVFHALPGRERQQWSYCQLVTANTFAEDMAGCLLKSCLVTSTQISIVNFFVIHRTEHVWLFSLTFALWMLALFLWVALAWFEVERKYLLHDRDFVGDFGWSGDITLQTKLALLFGEMMSVPEHFMKGPCTFHVRHMSRSFAVLKNCEGQRAWFLGFLSKEQKQLESCVFAFEQKYVIIIKGLAINFAQILSAFWEGAPFAGFVLRLALAIISFGLDMWDLKRATELRKIVLQQLKGKIDYVEKIREALLIEKRSGDQNTWFKFQGADIKVHFTPDDFFVWKTYTDELRTLTSERNKVLKESTTKEFIWTTGKSLWGCCGRCCGKPHPAAAPQPAVPAGALNNPLLSPL